MSDRPLAEEEVNRLVNDFLESGGHGPEEQDELAMTLAGRPLGVDALWRMLEHLTERNPDQHPNEIRAVVLGLSSASPVRRGTARRLIDLLKQAENPQIVAGVLDGLARTQHPDAWAILKRYLEHWSPEVRSAALRYAAATKPMLSWGLLVSGLRDEDPLVRENAVDELHELGVGVRDAIPMVNDLRHDPSERVRAAAEYAIRDLAEDFSNEEPGRKTA